MAKRRKKTNSTANRVRTSAPVMLIVLIGAGIGAVYYGFAAVLFAGQFKFGFFAVLGAGFVQGLVGAAIGAGFVGMWALILGAKLGPRFSYPFALSLIGGLGHLTSIVLEHLGTSPSDSFWAISITELVLASIIAEGLSNGVRGYYGRARSWAATSAFSVLLIASSILWWKSGQQSFSLSFAIRAMSFAAYGAAFGAIAGAVKTAR